MDPRALPVPEVLRRRHLALAAVEELLGRPYGFQMFGSEPPERFWFDPSSGDFCELFVSGEEALLSVFDHESPRACGSGGGDEISEWPGLLKGLPDRLRRGLPERDDDEPLYVSACFWFTDGEWHEGEPDPVPRDGDAYDDDPGGAAGVLAPLLHPHMQVEEMLSDSQPQRRDEAFALMRDMGVDCSNALSVVANRVGLLVRWGDGPPARGDDRLSFALLQFADLSDGRRVLQRGSGAFELVPVERRPRVPGSEPVTGFTLADVEDTVREDIDDPEVHSWEPLAAALHDAGVTVQTRDLDRLPAVIEFAPDVRARFNG